MDIKQEIEMIKGEIWESAWFHDSAADFILAALDLAEADYRAHYGHRHQEDISTLERARTEYFNKRAQLEGE